MLIMPSFKKSLIVEQFQGNYLKSLSSDESATDGPQTESDLKGG